MAHSTSRDRLLFGAALLGLLVGCGGDPEPLPEPRPVTEATIRALDETAAARQLLEAQPEPTVLDGRPVLLAGRPGGGYYETSRALARAGAEVRAPLALLAGQGSVDALYGVALGLGDLGIVQADVLTDPRHAAVRPGVDVLAPLVRERIYVVVPSGGASDVWGLSGKRIAIGPVGGGGASTAGNLLQAIRTVQADLAAQEQYVAFEEPTLIRLATGAALASLARGELDAVLVVGADPNVELLRAKSGLTLLSLDEAVVSALTAIEPAYRPVTVDHAAEGFYPASLGTTRTVAVPGVLVARAGLSAWAPIERLRARLAEGVFPADFPFALANFTNPSEFETRPGLTVGYRDPGLPLRIAAGAAAGTYAQVAEGIARVLEGVGASVEPIATSGALQNLALVASGQAELAIVQEDLLLEALSRPGTAPVVARARLIAPLFAEEVHLVGAAAQAGPLGLRFGLGEAGSGTFLTARRLLRQLGVAGHEVTGVAADRATTLAALEAGELDAAWFVGGQPLEFLVGLGHPFVSLSDQPGYAAATLRPESYPQLAEPLTTVATRALLVCRFDLDPELVAAITEALFANRQNLAQGHAKWTELDPEASDAPEGLQAHPGAVQAREAGLEVDSASPW